MNKSYQFLIIMLAIITASTGQAQEILVPKGLTAHEESIISNFQFRSLSASEAPALPVRTSAEWEEVEYLVLGVPTVMTTVQLQIVQAVIDECKIIIATPNPQSVENYLIANGVDMTDIIFIEEPVNSIWIRDYAAHTVYTNEVEDLALVDWIYNRPRPDDDVLPFAHAEYLGLPIYSTNSGTTDLVSVGGNFMTDGLGNAFASKLVLMENQAGNFFNVTPKTEAQIDNIMQDYMGIDNFIKMDVLPYDGIHHIDMHMKLLDEETILVSQFPEGVADGPQIAENIEYITSNFLTPFGNTYDIQWVDAPPSIIGEYPDMGAYYRTYTNSIFVNKTVLVPIYRPEYDQAALALYQELLPGYNIVGINVESMISGGGAIHCITHTIGVEDPLWIVHEKVREANTYTDIPIEAMIKHNSGISQAKVFWRETGTESFEESTMSYISDDNWLANIDIPTDTETVEYYIWAEAESGKTLTRPLVAPDGYWTFTISNVSSQQWAEKNITGPYPNPAKEQIHFNIQNISEEITISIHSMLGQKLYENTLPISDGKISLNLNPKWHGTLIVTFSGSFGNVHRKVIKLQ